jgi:predicted nucleic acid-binding protein
MWSFSQQVRTSRQTQPDAKSSAKSSGLHSTPTLAASQARGETSNISAATNRHSASGFDFGRIRLHHAPPLALQKKLTVNTPGDSYEQEADRVSQTVMRMPVPQLQRACSCGGTCADCKKKLQTKAVSSGVSQIEAPPIVHNVLRSPGQPLDSSTRAFMEPRFGWDFSRVRVHSNAEADQSAGEVNARAYTVGNDVVFAANQFSPASREGRSLLAHELTHVVQQSTVGSDTVRRAPGDASTHPPPARIIIIDANIIGEINRGNKDAASQLRALLASDTVYIAEQQYKELTSQPGKMMAGVGPDLPRTAAANKRLLEELHIAVAPKGDSTKFDEVLEANKLARNTLSAEDVQTAATAKANDAEVFSLDKSFRSQDLTALEKRLGIRIAAASQTLPVVGRARREDYRVARELLGLEPLDISVGGRIKQTPAPPRSSGGGGGGKSFEPSAASSSGGQTEQTPAQPTPKAQTLGQTEELSAQTTPATRTAAGQNEEPPVSANLPAKVSPGQMEETVGEAGFGSTASAIGWGLLEFAINYLLGMLASYIQGNLEQDKIEERWRELLPTVQSDLKGREGEVQELLRQTKLRNTIYANVQMDLVMLMADSPWGTYPESYYDMSFVPPVKISTNNVNRRETFTKIDNYLGGRYVHRPLIFSFPIVETAKAAETPAGFVEIIRVVHNSVSAIRTDLTALRSGHQGADFEQALRELWITQSATDLTTPITNPLSGKLSGADRFSLAVNSAHESVRILQTLFGTNPVKSNERDLLARLLVVKEQLDALENLWPMVIKKRR